jgi:hypothetical protein
MTKPDDAPQPAPAWQSAADIPAWVPLRLLRPAVALAIGEAAADAVTRSIMRAVARGAVTVRFGLDFVQWRQRAKELGHELQHAGDYRAGAGGMLGRPGQPLNDMWVFDQVQGIVLAPGDPRGMKRPGVWPMGPVDLAWADVEVLPAFRDAQARAAAAPARPAEPSSSPAVVAHDATDEPPEATPSDRAEVPPSRAEVGRFVRQLAHDAAAEGRKLTQAEAEESAMRLLGASRSVVRTAFRKLPKALKHTRGGRPRKARPGKGPARP